MSKLRIDLHAHSNASDGTESPSELVKQANDAGIDVVAITDHDTLAGWGEAITAANYRGTNLIPGLELSTAIQGRSVHIVSYLVDPEFEPLQQELETIRMARFNRAQVIIENLQSQYDIVWEQVLLHAPPGAVVGRPHIADTLVELGYASDRSAAFHEILHPDFGFTIPLYAPDPVRGISLIRDAGGVPVLAHPAANRFGRTIPQSDLARLVDAGLFGLEIEHPENFDIGKKRLYEMAQYFGLAVTGSSDWHGTGKTNRFGDGLTEQPVLDQILREGNTDQAILNTYRG